MPDDTPSRTSRGDRPDGEPNLGLVPGSGDGPVAEGELIDSPDLNPDGEQAAPPSDPELPATSPPSLPPDGGAPDGGALRAYETTSDLSLAPDAGPTDDP